MEEEEASRHRYNQRHSIFQTKCKCKNKVCKVIVDSGSFENIISVEMVEKLNIPRVSHDLPYRAYGLGDEKQIDVLEKLYVYFNIGPYFDTIECDIMPLKDCHLILGRAWQYDRSTIYDGRENTYTLNKDGKRQCCFH